MSNDGRIYIIISDKRGGDGTPTPGVPDEKKPQQTSGSSNMLLDFAKHKFFNLIESQAKQAVNYSISNIGNFTGDYLKQQNLQSCITFMNQFGSLGSTFVTASLATGSPVGGLVASTVQLASSLGTGALQEYSFYIADKKQNYEISQLRKRSGLSSLDNNGRGTKD